MPAFTTHYIPGQKPYTEAELTALHALVHDAAEAAERIPADQLECRHPPTRIFTWFAFDGTLCAGCSDCGAVLTGTP